MVYKASYIAIFCLAILSSGASLPFVRDDGRPVVDTSQGRVVGINETSNNINILTYRAIPFGKPPTHELRFMAPVPSAPWDGDLDAVEEPTPCPQGVSTGREDCLYLNVYTPESALNVNTTGEPLAVMIYTHGGAFMFGNAQQYDRVHELVRHDVIVVLLQYRLGVLGFFSTDDDVAPGNQGLKDQTLAIKWVNDNIESFGGDPQRITIFGESAGSICTHFQLLAPSAQGLFQNAILMSGNTFMPWSVGRNFYNVSRKIANRFFCPEEPSEALITCLQGVNYLLLSDMYLSFAEWNGQPFVFAPRIDGTYIPDEPARLVKEGRFSRVPTIMGVVRDEGAFESGELYAFPNIIDSLVDNFTINGPISLLLYDDEDPLNTANAVYDYYLGGINITEENADELTKLLTDRYVQIGFDWLVQQQANQAELYTYEFNYRGEWGLMDSYKSAFGLNLTAAEDWICHADDVPYLFNNPPKETAEDLEISDMFSSLFTNFAKFGNPTPDDSVLGFAWPPTNGTDLWHLSIALSPSMEDDTRQEARAFWESLPLRINSILQN